ncbi:MAG: integrase arm-type DNA-binding domain-containing protein [Oxalicibacterium faecigallinarum]|uniref:tyrosine-type recombinase/integrase n=1 Tax=Oxalicibacterium faecigallinarum TaxID=573741 RepID=UPI002808CA29|nr:integrase arm-type DNA-binding domain-containing protein [Oxalicibacterium faecigallinarum]MDQ7970552.1 integrase arm-type DNA-binding domain-containing protein [Oxalicibacterium faecigallinarum]
MALSDIKIRSAKPSEKQYKLTDGEGMHLLVHPSGAKYWRYSYRFGGKQKTLALGVYPDITLVMARHKRVEARKLLVSGIDPAAQRKEELQQIKSASTFEELAREWHSNNRKWSDAHRTRILQSLVSDIFPSIGHKSVQDLKTKDLVAPIKAVAHSGRLELASRLQQRVTSIMRFAVQSGMIDYNPAQDIAGTVPVTKVTHRPALDLSRLPELLQRISAYKGRPLTRSAVLLTLLVFLRSSELRFSRWSEVDLENTIWTIPPKREVMEGVKFSHRGAKMQTAHLVPLSTQAVMVFTDIQAFSGNQELIFCGDHDSSKPMSENTVNKALRTMGYDTKTEVCGHGFRTMACSALIESGLWSRDAVERQMSHQERNSVRAAYIHKAEHLEERRLMMQWWADFLDANTETAISPFDFSRNFRKPKFSWTSGGR